MKKIRLEDIFDYQYPSMLTYAPDGSAFAWLLTKTKKDKKGYETNLWIHKNDENIQLTHDGKVRSFFFEDKDHILFDTVRGEEDEKKEKDEEIFTTLYRLSLNGGEAEKAYTFPLPAGDFKKISNTEYLLRCQIDAQRPDFYKLSEDKKKKIYEEMKAEKDYEVLTESPFFSNGRGIVQGKRSALFLFDTKSGKLKRLTAKTMNVSVYRVSGKDVYFTGMNYKTKMPKYEGIYHLNLTEGKTEEIFKPCMQIMTIEWLQDKLFTVAVEGLRYGENENPYFYVFDLKKKKMSLLKEADESLGMGIITDTEYGASRFMKSDEDYIYFTSIVKDHCELRRVDENGKIETVISGYGSVNDYDVYKGNPVYMGMFDMKLPEIYKDDEQLTHFNDAALKGKYVAQPQYIRTTYKDEEIDGWVLLPEKFNPKKKYPAVLDIHGGPKCAYGTVFFHEMQAWAAKGYIVMFCNPHGSDGKGSQFASLDMQWGDIDYKQIMAFVDKVLKTYPAVDETKLCCTGGSYGGYMSNWIMGHTDRFCCIATQRSIANWITMYGVSDIPPLFCSETCDTNPYSDQGFKEMWDVSPLRYVDNAKTPTLFIHSDEDHRCPIEEGMQMYTALVYKGVEARMVVFHGENHELSRSGRPDHRLRRLQEITDWFDKHTA